MIRFDILSVFPEMFESVLNYSILKRAREKGMVEIHLHNIRDYAEDKHRMTDDAPYGGGGGMVMKVEPIDRALASIVPARDNTTDCSPYTPGRNLQPEDSGGNVSLFSNCVCLRALRGHGREGKGPSG